jgi:hypothetical protein
MGAVVADERVKIPDTSLLPSVPGVLLGEGDPVIVCTCNVWQYMQYG